MIKVLVCILVGVSFLAACGEREQVAEGKRTYQGKRDTKAWDNAPPAVDAGGRWQKGDKASWEREIKARQLIGQDEYQRIGR